MNLVRVVSTFMCASVCCTALAEEGGLGLAGEGAAGGGPGLAGEDAAAADDVQPEDVLDDGPSKEGEKRAADNRLWRPIFDASLSMGNDTNVPVLPDQIDAVSNTDSLFVESRVDVGAKYRGESNHRFRAMASGQWTHYTEASEFDLARYGLLGSWQKVTKTWLPHAVLTYNHYRIDNESTLNDLALTAGTAYLHSNKQVSIATIRIRDLDYTDNDPISGQQFIGRFTHWFVFGSAGRRLEPDLRLGWFDAGTDVESYTTIRPGIVGRWRWDELGAGERIDVRGAIKLDYRSYDEPRTDGSDDEDSSLWNFDIDATWWITPRIGVGGYVRYTERNSNEPLREYDRTRTGLTAEFSW